MVTKVVVVKNNSTITMGFSPGSKQLVKNQDYTLTYNGTHVYVLPLGTVQVNTLGCH